MQNKPAEHNKDNMERLHVYVTHMHRKGAKLLIKYSIWERERLFLRQERSLGGKKRRTKGKGEEKMMIIRWGGKGGWKGRGDGGEPWMSVCLSLRLGQLSLRGAHLISLRFLFIYLSAYFYPCDQDSDGALRNRGRNVQRVGLPASRAHGS